MKKERLLAYFLMVVCMVMLTAAVFPHHHHLNFICLQHDLATCMPTEMPCSCGEADCPSVPCQSTPSGCEDGCVTQFHFSVPSSGMDFQPVFPLITLLYSMVDIGNLCMLEEGKKQACIYIESLHSSAVLQSVGLRAPPCA